MRPSKHTPQKGTALQTHGHGDRWPCCTSICPSDTHVPPCAMPARTITQSGMRERINVDPCQIGNHPANGKKRTQHVDASTTHACDPSGTNPIPLCLTLALHVCSHMYEHTSARQTTAVSIQSDRLFHMFIFVRMSIHMFIHVFIQMYTTGPFT